MIFDTPQKFGRFKSGKAKKTDSKTLFRASQSWKVFRKTMIEMQKNTCEMCGMVYNGAKVKSLQVHHLRPDEYEVLNPAEFSVVCASCHDLAERFVTRINGRFFEPPYNFQEWCQLILPHLSYPARQKAKDILAGKNTKAEKPKRKKV